METIPGTNFAIRRSILDTLGGWDEKALAEDTELSIRVYDLGYYIRFFPAAITWEQEPETWKVWWRQRTRWARGNQYVIVKFLMKYLTLERRAILFDLFYFFLSYFLFFFFFFLFYLFFFSLYFNVCLLFYYLILFLYQIYLFICSYQS